MIDGLPQGSRYLAAVLSDEEFAEQLLDQEDDLEGSKDTGPSLIGYRQDNYQLAELNDQLKILNSTIIAVNGGKAKKVTPTPRPTTKVEEIKRQREQESAQKVAELFSPKNS